MKEQATTMRTIVLALKRNIFQLLDAQFPIDQSTLYLYEETEYIYYTNKAHFKEIKLFDF